jgi:hypothetical protein
MMREKCTKVLKIYGPITLVRTILCLMKTSISLTELEINKKPSGKPDGFLFISTLQMYDDVPMFESEDVQMGQSVNVRTF